MELNPMSVLDIGAGFGKYGVLCREYLEYWGPDAALEWKRKIDAVEAFASYISPLHRYIYDNIYQDDVLKIIDLLRGYDLVLLIDVLEHFEKELGYYLLYKLVDNDNKAVLVSTPRLFTEQADTFSNEYERHRSAWTEDELNCIGSTTTTFIPDDRSIICLLEKH